MKNPPRTSKQLAEYITKRLSQNDWLKIGATTVFFGTRYIDIVPYEPENPTIGISLQNDKKIVANIYYSLATKNLSYHVFLF